METDAQNRPGRGVSSYDESLDRSLEIKTEKLATVSSPCALS